MNHPTVLGLLGMAIIEVVLTLIVTGFSYSARKSGTRGRTLGAAWIVAVVVFVTTAFSSAILDSVGNLGFSILVLAGALVSLACSLAVALSLGKLYGCLPKELFSLRLPPRLSQASCVRCVGDLLAADPCAVHGCEAYRSEI